jgi:hypothetical protein
LDAFLTSASFLQKGTRQKEWPFTKGENLKLFSDNVGSRKVVLVDAIRI